MTAWLFLTVIFWIRPIDARPVDIKFDASGIFPGRICTALSPVDIAAGIVAEPIANTGIAAQIATAHRHAPRVAGSITVVLSTEQFVSIIAVGCVTFCVCGCDSGEENEIDEP